MKEQSSEIKRTCRFSFLLRAAAAVCLCSVFLMAQSGGITTKDPKAKEAVDAALKALGGADKIGGIKSLIIKGTGTNAVFSGMSGGPLTKTGTLTYEFEIRMLLPDSFVQINRFPDRTAYTGVSQGTPLSSPMMMMGSVGGVNIQGPPPEVAEAMAKTQANNLKDEWSRFLIGTLAKAGPTPLTLSPGSASGVSGVFTLTKTDGDFGEVEFDSKTGYPSVVRYKTAGLPTTIIDPATGRVSTTGPRGMVENEIRFQDRFSVNGVMFPRIITTTAPGMRDTEIRITDVQINPNLSLKDFEVPK